jgi:hypothetical protein
MLAVNILKLAELYEEDRREGYARDMELNPAVIRSGGCCCR